MSRLGGVSQLRFVGDSEGTERRTLSTVIIFVCVAASLRIVRLKIIMSTSTQQKNEDPSRGGGGRGGQGRRGGRGKKKRNSGGGGGDADTTRWRALEKPYRDWLIRYGLASNAEDFGKLSIGERIEAVEAYKKISREDAEAARLDILYRQKLLAQTNPYAAIAENKKLRDKLHSVCSDHDQRLTPFRDVFNENARLARETEEMKTKLNTFQMKSIATVHVRDQKVKFLQAKLVAAEEENKNLKQQLEVKRS